MTDNVTDQDLGEVVRAWISQQGAHLEQLRVERENLDAEIERIRQRLAEISPLATALGYALPDDLLPKTLTPRGRTGTRLPARRPEFQNVRLLAALEKVFAERPGEPIHADEFVRRIFDQATPAQLRAAKSSVVPVLSQGVLEERWKRVAPNTFLMEMEEGESAGVNGAPPLFSRSG